MSGNIIDEAEQKLASSVAGSFAKVAENAILGLGGEGFARRTARAENVKQATLNEGKLERARIDRVEASAVATRDVIDQEKRRRVERGLARIADEILFNETNLETIVAKAAELADADKDSAYQSEPHTDWIRKWISYAQEVSTPELQMLWARSITQQTHVGASGISLKALDTLRFIDLAGAKAFERMLKILETSQYLIDYEMFGQDGDVAEAQASIDAIELAKDIGLIRTESYATLELDLVGLVVRFDEVDSSKPGKLNALMLSKVGEELAEVASPGFWKRRNAWTTFDSALRNAKSAKVVPNPSDIDPEPVFERFRILGALGTQASRAFGFAFTVSDAAGEKEIAQLHEGVTEHITVSITDFRDDLNELQCEALTALLRGMSDGW